MGIFQNHLMGAAAAAAGGSGDTSATILIAGGYQTVNVIQKILSSSAANSTDFGDLNAGRHGGQGAGNATIGLFGGGNDGSYMNEIDKIVIASAGNATDFGNLTQSRQDLCAGTHNDTRAVFAGGYTGSYVNTIDYSTFASAADAVDFGDATTTYFGGGQQGGGNGTRGLYGLTSSASGATQSIDRINIASTGNGVDFGDSGTATTVSAGCGNDTKYFMAGGWVNGSTYVDDLLVCNISSDGNMTDFGDITAGGRYGSTGASSKAKGIVCHGQRGGNTNEINQWNLASSGDTTDFGDCTNSVQKSMAVSSNDGGTS